MKNEYRENKVPSTRKNLNVRIKEAISSTIKLNDEKLVIGLLEFLQTDKKIKTLTDTAELTFPPQ